MCSVQSHETYADMQLSRVLRRGEDPAAGSTDREAPPALLLLPHQLPTEAEPERQRGDSHRILSASFCNCTAFFYFYFT